MTDQGYELLSILRVAPSVVPGATTLRASVPIFQYGMIKITALPAGNASMFVQIMH